MWCFSKNLCTRHAWVGALLWWSCPSPLAHRGGLLNHLYSFHSRMSKLNVKSDAVSLLYLFSHFECNGHRVHMLTQQCLLPHWLVQWSHHCSHMCIPIHFPWLTGSIDVKHTVLIILTMARFFPDKSHIGFFFFGGGGGPVTWSRIARLQRKLMLTILRKCYIVFWNGSTILNSYQLYMRIPITPHSHQCLQLPAFHFSSFWWFYSSISVWLSFAFPWWLIILSTFSYVLWLFEYLYFVDTFSSHLLIFSLFGLAFLTDF